VQRILTAGRHQQVEDRLGKIALVRCLADEFS
jgi:hypothetical protein